MTKSSFSIQSLTKMGLLTALLCASAYLVIPLPFTPVSLTAQTLLVNLTALLLSPRESFFTVLTYVLLGTAGLPVFSGGMGGPAKLFGPTGGYILSWFFAVPLMSALKGTGCRFLRCFLVCALAGMPVIYLFGTLYMMFLTHVNAMTALSSAVIPFIPLDLFKCAAAALIARPLTRAARLTAS